MKRILSVLLAVALAIALVPALPVTAQSGGLVFKRPIRAQKSTDDTDVAIVVRYVGPTIAGNNTVQTSATAITFVKGGVAYDGFECPVSGALGGVITVTDAACNTLGEVVDVINNGPVTGFRAFILDGLRSDSSAKLITASAADATPAAGLNLYTDSDVALWSQTAMVPCRTFDCYSGGGKTLPTTNPYRGTISAIKFYAAGSTFATTSTISVLSVKPLNGSPTSETVSTVYQVAGAASTTVQVKDAATFGPDGLFGDKDAKLILRVLNTGASSAFTAYASGNQYTY